MDNNNLQNNIQNNMPMQQGMYQQPMNQMQQGMYQQPMNQMQQGMYQQPINQMQQGMYQQPVQQITPGPQRMSGNKQLNLTYFFSGIAFIILAFLPVFKYSNTAGKKGAFSLKDFFVVKFKLVDYNKVYMNEYNDMNPTFMHNLIVTAWSVLFVFVIGIAILMLIQSFINDSRVGTVITITKIAYSVVVVVAFLGTFNDTVGAYFDSVGHCLSNGWITYDTKEPSIGLFLVPLSLACIWLIEGAQKRKKTLQ